MFLEKINYPDDLKKLSVADLKILADEIRGFLLKTVANTGGHLASNLGVVELTLAIHYIFDCPKDKLIWDVGHQSYVHKLLTGRKGEFSNLRKYKGISGFPKPTESPYDTYIVGHSSTSLSLASGTVVARDLRQESHKVLAVIGDGALTGGMAYEGLNNLGHMQKDVLIILNSNEMSISPNVGAISRYISRIITGKRYNQFKAEMEKILQSIPTVGKAIINLKNKIMESIKMFFVPGILFEELGFLYIGPDNGHDLELLIRRLTKIKEMKGRPILYHVITKKGKGYDHAENEPSKFHGIPKFDIETGRISKKGVLNYTDIFSRTLLRLAEKDNRILAVTAAMCEGTGLEAFKDKFPDRFFDVGIAEQHAVTFSAALARNGFKPAVAIYSTFLQRAYDQIIHDVAISRLPVKFFVDRAGLVGEDGETHQGIFDISFLRTVPGMVILSPRNGNELMDMVHTAMQYDKGPVCVRYPRFSIPETTVDFNRPFKDIPIGEIEVLNQGKDIGILATGVLVENTVQALPALQAHGLNPSLFNIRSIKPVREEQLVSLVRDLEQIIILEENIVNGGLGEYILALLSKQGIHKKIKLINLGDRFIEQGAPDILRMEAGLSTEKIAEAVMNFCGNK
ncbi:MAG: 1-deoxy-D-xylulose-5-phosphate synthase [bacterium]|nr:1-deoxy-D-xylulose-5-phosphate synthase [bacterium]